MTCRAHAGLAEYRIPKMNGRQPPSPPGSLGTATFLCGACSGAVDVGAGARDRLAGAAAYVDIQQVRANAIKIDHLIYLRRIRIVTFQRANLSRTTGLTPNSY